MLFIGQFEHTIDAKGRLAIPSEIRSRWRAEEDGAAWYAMPWIGGVIRLFTESEFKKLASPVMPQTLALSADEAALKRILFGRSRRLEMDNAGRIRLPESMLSLVKLGRDVVLVGCGDCLEITDRAGWQESEQDDLEQLAQLLTRMSRPAADKD